MSRTTGPTGILHHIRHAEQWLRWARSDCERGDARAAVLRLLLAEAEVRRARESGTQVAPEPLVPLRRRRTAVVAGALAAAAVLATTGYIMLRSSGPNPDVSARPALRAVPAADGREAIVRFESGRFLALMGLPPGGWPGSERGAGWAASGAAGGLGGRLSDDLVLPAGDQEPALPYPR